MAITEKAMNTSHVQTIWQTINPSPEELFAACSAFGELPKIDVLSRLIMARRAVAAGFYTDDLPKHGRRLRQPVERSRAVTRVRRPARTRTSTEGGVRERTNEQP
jgi:hypothetical protein